MDSLALHKFHQVSTWIICAALHVQLLRRILEEGSNCHNAFWLAIHVVHLNPSLKPYQPGILVADLRLWKWYSSKWNEAKLSTSPGSTWVPSPRSRNLRPAKACRCDERKERWRPEEFLWFCEQSRYLQFVQWKMCGNTWERVRTRLIETFGDFGVWMCLACDPNASNRQALLLHKCARLKLWSNTCDSKVLQDCPSGQSQLQLSIKA